VSPRRADVLVGAGGALVGGGAGLLWGGVVSVSALVLGGALGFSRRFPRATWLSACAVLLACGAAGVKPGNDDFAGYLLVAAHAFCARDVAGLVALAICAQAGALLAGTGETAWVFIVAAPWGAGRVLRRHRALAVELAARGRELEEEREAFAALSVRYERARIASELHDIVAHAISVMVVQASAGQRLPDPSATFDVIADAARQAEADMVRLVALLGDAPSGDAPDLALIDELVARANGSGLVVTLRLEGDREGLPPAVVLSACRVVQEGLTNALRYAAGAHVAVRVRGEADTLVVSVENGPAMSEPVLAGSGTGNGIRGLRERVGVVQAGPTSDGGWRLAATIPAAREVAP
jgi:signal transduction histidine kinase